MEDIILKKDAAGNTIIPGSQRADGSFRKEIKVRAGYIPDGEIKKYVIPQKRDTTTVGYNNNNNSPFKQQSPPPQSVPVITPTPTQTQTVPNSILDELEDYIDSDEEDNTPIVKAIPTPSPAPIPTAVAVVEEKQTKITPVKVENKDNKKSAKVTEKPSINKKQHTQRRKDDDDLDLISLSNQFSDVDLSCSTPNIPTTTTTTTNTTQPKSSPNYKNNKKHNVHNSEPNTPHFKRNNNSSTNKSVPTTPITPSSPKTPAPSLATTPIPTTPIQEETLTATTTTTSSLNSASESLLEKVQKQVIFYQDRNDRIEAIEKKMQENQNINVFDKALLKQKESVQSELAKYNRMLSNLKKTTQ